MKIWITRHGQTNLNKAHLMQGRVDEPLNEVGKMQAQEARKQIENVHFDAVFASPLDRAIETASILGHVPRSTIQIDERIIETDFGKYEKRPYNQLGIRMSLYWACPEIFPAPKSVESIDAMVTRAHGFLKELETKDYENVLIVCHGGIMRVLCGYFEGRPFVWRPKPKNCEIRMFQKGEGHVL